MEIWGFTEESLCVSDNYFRLSGVLGTLLSQVRSEEQIALTCSFGVYHSLRNSLSVKMCHLVSENHILNKKGPSGPSGHDIKFISYGVPASSGQDIGFLREHGRERSTAESVRLTPGLTRSSPAISTPSSPFLSSLCAEHDILKQSALGNPSHPSTSVPKTLVLGSRGD